MAAQPNQPILPEMSAQLNQRTSFEIAAQPIPPEVSQKDWASYFQYKPERDTASDVRSALSVVLALIAAATFQAAINPPGGVWPDTSVVNGTIHYAGNSILSSNKKQCKVFVFCNTLAFSSSVYVISFLVYRFPFYMEIWIALVSLSATYGASIGSLQPPDTNCTTYAIVAFFVPLVWTFMVKQIERAWRRATR